MKNALLKLFIFVALPLFFSCIKTVEREELVNPQIPKIVIEGVISTEDSVVIINISKTKPYFNTSHNLESLIIPDAEVLLSDGEKQIKLEYSPNINYYGFNRSPKGTFFTYAFKIQGSDFKIIPGQIYNLSVKTKEGFIAKASCKVPEFKHPIKLKLYRLRRNKYNGYANYNLQFTPEDSMFLLNERQFMVTSKTKVIKRDSTYFFYGGYHYILLNSFLSFNGELSLTYDSQYYLETLRKTEGFYIGIWDQKIKEFLIQHDQLNYPAEMGEMRPGNFNSLDDNPASLLQEFIYSEPIPYFSNIEGGIGIFGAKNEVWVPVDIPSDPYLLESMVEYR